MDGFVFFAIHIILASFFLHVLFIWLRILRRNRILSRIPGPATKWPLIGNMDLFWRRGVPLNESTYLTGRELAEKYGRSEGIFRFALGPQTVVGLCKPETVEPILTSRVHTSKADYYSILSDWLGDGLLTVSGPKWRTHRRMLIPAFNLGAEKEFISVTNKHYFALVSRLVEEGATYQDVTISEVLSSVSLDILCETMLGMPRDSHQGLSEEYITSTEKMEQIFLERIYRPLQWSNLIFYLMAAGRQFRRCLQYVVSVNKQLIQMRIRQRSMSTLSTVTSDDDKHHHHKNSKNSRDRRRFLDLLLDHHLRRPDILTMKEVLDEVNTIMFVGHESTSTALAWAVFTLGHNTHIQHEIQRELDSIFGEDRLRPVTEEDLKQLKYLDMVYKESARLRSSPPCILRKVGEDCRIGGYLLPAGTQVGIMMERIHHDPNCYPDPLVFDPERFSAENSAKRHPMAYIPFSAGPRSCLARKFAGIQMKIALAHFFRNFHCKSLTPLDQVRVSGDAILRPLVPLRIRIMKRQLYPS